MTRSTGAGTAVLLSVLFAVALVVPLAPPPPGQVTAGKSSGLRGLGYTEQLRPQTAPEQGASLPQSSTCTWQAPGGNSGPEMLHADASEASSGVV